METVNKREFRPVASTHLIRIAAVLLPSEQDAAAARSTGATSACVVHESRRRLQGAET